MSRSEITVARHSDTLTLNPLLYTDLVSGEINNRLNDHLIMTDEHMHFIPGRLLQAWEVSEDGLVWTFRMKQGAHWHDGVEVTAHDAQFTFEAILDPAVGSPRRSEFIVGGEAVQFRAVDRYTLQARLPGPFAPFLDALAWRPLIPRHLFAGRNPLEPFSAEGRWPVGNGPFRMAEWKEGDRLVMAANQQYHLPSPAMDRVVWRYVPDKTAAVSLLLDGEVDYVPGLGPEESRRVVAHDDLTLRRYSDGNCTYVAFQVEHPLFRDIRVRQALCHATDRDALVKLVLSGQGEVAHSMVSPVRPWHNPKVARYGYDLQRAQELLESAGWERRADGGWYRGNEPLQFTLLTVVRDPIKEKAAHLVAAQLGQIGVKVAVRPLEQKELLSQHVYPRQYEAALLAMVPTFDVDDLYGFYHSSQLTPKGWNRFNYSNPDVDRLLEQGRTTIGFKNRKPLYDRVQELVAADLPQMALFHVHTIDGYNRRLVVPQSPGAYGNRYMLMHAWRVVHERATGMAGVHQPARAPA